MGNLRPANIREADWIIEHIHQIALDTDEPSLTRDVIEACLNERAFLLLSKTGFLVVKPMIRDGNSRLLLWVAWSSSGKPEYSVEDLDYLGDLFGVDELEFWTKRKGFARLGPRLGFDLVEMINGFNVWRKAL